MTTNSLAWFIGPCSCLSSCLDYWEDDLFLQAFSRNLILSPQLYGSPWFLRDDEFPKLARLFNLHRRYREILTKGMVLPEENYGPHAVSRGNGTTRLVTLRNLGWEPVTRTVALDGTIGLDGSGVKQKLRSPGFFHHDADLGENLDRGAVDVAYLFL